MVSLPELFLKFQNLKQQQQVKPVDTNTINAQLSRMMPPTDQGVAAIPVHNVGRPNAYADGGIVAFSGPTGSLVGGNINPMTPDLTELESELTRAGYDADSKAEILRRAAASRARTGAAPSSTRAPYSVDSNEEILKRAAANRVAPASGQVAAPAAAEGAAAEGAAAEAAPGMLSRLGSMAGRLFSGARGLGIMGLLHSNDTAAQGDEMALIQKDRATRGLPPVYTPQTPTSAAPAENTAATDAINDQDIANSPLLRARTTTTKPMDPAALLAQLRSGDAADEKYLKDQAEQINPTKKGLKGYYQEQLDLLGPNKGLEDYKKYVDTLEGTAKINAQNDLRMAKAAAFFNMAAAAGKPGQAGSSLSKFLNAATVGGMSYAQAEPHIRQGLAAVQQKIAEDKFKIADAERRERSDIAFNVRREYGQDLRTFASMMGDITKFGISKRAEDTRLVVSELGAHRRSDQYLAQIESASIKADATERVAAARTGATNAEQQLRKTAALLADPSLSPEKQEFYKTQYTDQIAEYDAWQRHLAKLLGIKLPNRNPTSDGITAEMQKRGMAINK
jgi:hypothetical protein